MLPLMTKVLLSKSNTGSAAGSATAAEKKKAQDRDAALDALYPRMAADRAAKEGAAASAVKGETLHDRDAALDALYPSMAADRAAKQASAPARPETQAEKQRAEALERMYPTMAKERAEKAEKTEAQSKYLPAILDRYALLEGKPKSGTGAKADLSPAKRARAEAMASVVEEAKKDPALARRVLTEAVKHLPGSDGQKADIRETYARPHFDNAVYKVNGDGKDNKSAPYISDLRYKEGEKSAKFQKAFAPLLAAAGVGAITFEGLEVYILAASLAGWIGLKGLEKAMNDKVEQATVAQMDAHDDKGVTYVTPIPEKPPSLPGFEPAQEPEKKKPDDILPEQPTIWADPILEQQKPEIIEINKITVPLDHEKGDSVPDETFQGLDTIDDRNIKGVVSDLVLGEHGTGVGITNGASADGVAIVIGGGYENAERVLDQIISNGNFKEQKLVEAEGMKMKVYTSLDDQVRVILRDKTKTKGVDATIEIKTNNGQSSLDAAGEPRFNRQNLRFTFKLRF